MKNRFHISSSLSPTDEETFEEFAETLEGWTIKEVKRIDSDDDPEGWFKMELEKLDMTKEVTVCATELGAWLLEYT